MGDVREAESVSRKGRDRKESALIGAEHHGVCTARCASHTDGVSVGGACAACLAAR